MTRPTDPTDGQLHVEGPNVLRWQDGTWLLQEPLGLPSRPNLAALRADWVGRWVLIAHPDPDRGVQAGFVDRFAMVDGQVVVVLDDGQAVQLERHSTMAHDPVGRGRHLAELLEDQREATRVWAADLLRARAVVLRSRDDDLAAHELDGCAGKIDGSAVHVTATTFQGA